MLRRKGEKRRGEERRGEERGSVHSPNSHEAIFVTVVKCKISKFSSTDHNSASCISHCLYLLQ